MSSLLAEIHPLVLRYCRGRLGRQETVIGSADDVAQEICLAVVNALAGYTVKGLSFRAFVYGIAAHKVTDAFRAIGRNRTEPMAELPDAPAPHDDPEQQALAGELAQRLGGLLHQLTPRQREVLDTAGRGRSERRGDGGRPSDRRPAPCGSPSTGRSTGCAVSSHRTRPASWTTDSATSSAASHPQPPARLRGE